MAWNGSVNNNGAAKTPEKRKPRKSSGISHGLLAGLVIVAAGFAALYFFSRPEDDSPETAKAKPSAIAETEADLSTNINKTVEKVPVEIEDRNSLEWLKKNDPRYFVPTDAVRRPNGRLYTKDGRRILEDLPARKLDADSGHKRIFQHPSEAAIARIIKIEPGQVFIGDMNFGQAFLESFKKSLVEPTLYDKDDDAETRALKKEVVEIKAELKERMDSGEDICQIMRDAQAELRELATYRQDLLKNLAVLRFDESVSEQDYADYVEAASKMLQDKGMKGLTMPSFAKGQLKYMREVHNAHEAAKKTISTEE